MPISVSPGQPIKATHITQFTRWLTGVTKDTATLLTSTNASLYTLTVTNEETGTGPALKVVSGASTVALFNKSGVTFDSLVLTSTVASSSTLIAPDTPSWPRILYSGDDNQIQYSQSVWATNDSGGVRRVQIMHGAYTDPVVDMNNGVTHPTEIFYGPKATFLVSRYDASISNNCIATAAHGASAGVISCTLIPHYFNTVIQGSPKGVSGYYGLTGRLDAEVPMSALATCVHGSTYTQVLNFDANALSGIGRVQFDSNAVVRGLYAEATYDSTDTHAYAIGAEITVRRGVTQTGPAPIYTSVGYSRTIGIALESGIEPGASATTNYNSLGLLIAGNDTSNTTGAWRTGLLFVQNSILEYGIDMNPLGATAVATVPSGGLIRLCNNGPIVARNVSNSADVTALVLNTANTLMMYGTSVAINPPIFTLQGTNAGGSADLVLQNNGVTVAAAARIVAGASGSTGGDAFSAYVISGATSWYAGVDNSDSDAYVIGAGSAPGAANAIRIDSTGVTTMVGVWTAFTGVSLHQGGTAISTTINSARYRVWGKQAVVQIQLTANGPGTAGTEVTIFGIPATLAPLLTGYGVAQGAGVYLDSGSGYLAGPAVFPTATSVAIFSSGQTVAGGVVGVAPNFAAATNDTFSVALSYELA